MTTQEFNALPLEARRFIELHAGCLSCGNSAQKLTRAYELYKANRMEQVYVLFGGGINYSLKGERGVLYNISSADEPAEVKNKLEIAKKIYASNPEVFMSFDQKAIEELETTLPEAKVIDLDEADKWAERSAILGIDTKIASYPELQEFVKYRNIETEGQKKSNLVEAIDAIDTDSHTELE